MRRPGPRRDLWLAAGAIVLGGAVGVLAVAGRDVFMAGWLQVFLNRTLTAFGCF
jgi:hypothetical protein